MKHMPLLSKKEEKVRDLLEPSSGPERQEQVRRYDGEVQTCCKIGKEIMLNEDIFYI